MNVRTVAASRRTTTDDATRPTDRVAIGSVLIGGLLIAAIVGTRCGVTLPQVTDLPQALSDTGQAPHVQVGHQPHEVVSEVSVSARAGAQLASASEPAPSATLTVAAAPGDQLRVSGTDGQGVLLRTSPQNTSVTTRGFTEGWEVVVLELSGADWARVRGPNGQEGWVPMRYLSR
jgi:hypothetical protein